MKLSLSSVAFAALVGTANAASIRSGKTSAKPISPSVQIENTAYIGDDFGIACAKRGVEQVKEKHGASIVYCFNVINTGNTYLSNLIINNEDLGFFDNSIALLAPGASKLVTMQSTINGDKHTTATVTATPTLADKTAIDGAAQVVANGISHVVDTDAAVARRRKLQDVSKDAYAAPSDVVGECLQTRWNSVVGASQLICTEKEIHLVDPRSDEVKSCIAGEMVEITVDASIAVELEGTAFDLGWFVATDGGDAMAGSSCVVNGLQEGNEYELVDMVDNDVTAGTIAWRPDADGGDDDGGDLGGDDDGGDLGGTDDGNFGGGFDDPDDLPPGFVGVDPNAGAGATVPAGGTDRRLLGKNSRQLGPDDDGFGNDDGVDGLGDGDDCGDVYNEQEHTAVIKIPVIVKKMVLCQDSDEDIDSLLNVAVCFSWNEEKSADADGIQNDDTCTFDSLLPGDQVGNCYCSNYNIADVTVVTPDTTDDTKPC